MAYVPKPIDTSHVRLDHLDDVIERLAENAHEIWAQQRIKDGWHLGTTRDDARKEHPCLVPYAQLPESEKEYDRIMSSQTLKVLVALGYKITKS
jgi:ryanodine receptor 2